jgi:hypothetical protein
MISVYIWIDEDENLYIQQNECKVLSIFVHSLVNTIILIHSWIEEMLDEKTI